MSGEIVLVMYVMGQQFYWRNMSKLSPMAIVFEGMPTAITNIKNVFFRHDQ